MEAKKEEALDDSSRHMKEWTEMVKQRGAEIAPQDIILVEKIGDGSFGSVWKGKCFQMDVAVKIPHRQKLNPQQLESLRNEIQIMSMNPHPRIVLFMGACTIEGQFKIVTELMDGDLHNLIHKDKIRLSLYRKLLMMKDAALGMNWLHRSTPQIIHRDLKPGNLLLSRQGDEYRVKLCDFGLSSIKPATQEVLKDLGGARGTPMYMSPEVLKRQDFTEKTDCYSFGIVLWEVVTEELPFKGHRNYARFVTAVADEGERPLIPPETLPSLKSLMEDCWAHDPSKRPNFEEITKRLDSIILEAGISDPVGCNFWKLNFPEKYVVDWADFFPAFYRFINVDMPVDPEDPLTYPKPSKLPKRNIWDPPHKAVKEEMVLVPTMPPPGTPPKIEVVNYRCLKALFSVDNKYKDKKIVNIEWFNQILEWFPLTADSSFLDRVRDILGMPWFFGQLSNEDAQVKLGPGSKEGTFLVRFSSQPGAFTISRVGSNGSMSNIRIKNERKVIYGEDGVPAKVEVLYSVSDEKKYNSIIAVIDDISMPLNMHHAALGSPFNSIFGIKSFTGGGYEVLQSRTLQNPKEL